MPNNTKGQLLFIVIGTIMVVAALSTVILRIMLSQSRLIHHQVSRIQAQYAAKAGIIYALDKLRRNDDVGWPTSGQYVKTMCQSGCDINEPSLLNSIRVNITVYDLGTGVSGTRKVSARAVYTPL
jgi:Tfp pilus assembly protein PilX